MTKKHRFSYVAFSLPLFVCILFFSAQTHADIFNVGVMDAILDSYKGSASTWSAAIVAEASWLFWLLATVSMAWTFGFMLVRQADIGEFFAEFIRFIVFTGFFWWLLTNAPVYATAIIDSLKIIGADATGLRDSLSPSSIVDIGFDLFYRSISNSAFWSPSDSLIAFFMGMIVLVTLTLVAAQMVMLLVAGWILAYGGIFCLGFGGSRWTSDMAVNYYKAVLGVAASLFVMILLVGIGKTFLVACSTSLSAGFNFKEMGVMVVVCVALLVLVNRVPRLVAGIITDTDVGSIGSVGRYAGGMASVAFSGRASGISKRSPSGALMQEASVMTRAVSGGQSMAATSSSAFLHKSDDDAVSFGGSGVSSLAAAMGNNTSSGASLVLDKKAASS